MWIAASVWVVQKSKDLDNNINVKKLRQRTKINTAAWIQKAEIREKNDAWVHWGISTAVIPFSLKQTNTDMCSSLGHVAEQN